MQVKAYVGSIRRANVYVRSKVSIAPKVAVILGSGLSKAVPNLTSKVVIPYADIPGFPKPTVAGHVGKLVFGQAGQTGVAVMQGRFHYYEGYSMESITLPIRMLEYMGLKTLVVTAAVGSMKPGIRPGEFVVIRDHINLMGRNPLRAFHEEEFGEMFPDLSEAYSPALRRMALQSCRKKKVRAHEGVYVSVGGPSYETPAEIKAFRMLGGDVVGMSVVPEVIVARQMGINVVVVTWVSNMASGMPNASLRHPDVLAMGDRVAVGLREVLDDLLPRL